MMFNFSANQELLGIASANVMAGLGHGFPVSGGMTFARDESGGVVMPLWALLLPDQYDGYCVVRVAIASPPAACCVIAYGGNGSLQR